MANKTRPKPNKTRNNHIFKVVGGKASKAKGKPKPVDIKLKKVRVRKIMAFVLYFNRFYLHF